MSDLNLLLAQHSLPDGAARRPQHLNPDWYLFKDIRRSVTAAEEVLLTEFTSWIKRQRMHRDRYRATLRVLLANLWNTFLHNRELVVPATTASERKTAMYGYSPSIGQEIITFLVEKGYIVYQLGRADSFSGVASWCIAAPRLIGLIASKERHIVAKAPEFGVILRDKKKPGQDTGDDIVLEGRNKASAKSVGATAREMNALLAHSDILCPIERSAHLSVHYAQVPVALTRIFNNRSWELGGRYYCHYQNFEADDRRKLLIDNERVVELDYAALHARMVYAEVGVQYPMDQDPYGEAGSLERELNKAIMLRLFNVTDLSALKSCITRSGDPKTIQTHHRYQGELESYHRGDRKRAPSKPECLEGFIEDVPVGTHGGTVLQKLFDVHPRFKEALEAYEGNLGLYLQYKDSEIMTLVLKQLLAHSVPALPVHDSVIVPVSKLQLARDAMQEAFSSMYPGITIPITMK